MISPESIFSRTVSRSIGAAKKATAYAPSNIALSKYWGKRDANLNLPLNSSLSISLGTWGTETSISPSETDLLTFNGASLSEDDPAAAKVWRFVELFCGASRETIHISTTNSIPTAAGLASSASGFAALTMALDQAFDTGLDKERLSMLSRFGSGSATRSFWHGFVRWDKGVSADGTDSHGHPIPVSATDLRIAIIAVDTGPKPHSSRDGMNHTVATSPLFSAWPAHAEDDCNTAEAAILENDFVKLGELAEANALAMHATMMAARPALTYLKAESWTVLETLWHARSNGLRAHATMDAGANVKLIFRDGDTNDVLQVFPNAQVIDPFDGSGQN